MGGRNFWRIHAAGKRSYTTIKQGIFAVLKIINEINDIIESNWLVEDMNKQDANRLMGLLHSINEV